MKKTLLAIAASSFIALFAGCEKKEVNVPAVEQTITFIAETEQPSKAILDTDGISFLWEAKDKIGVWAERASDKYCYTFTNQSEATDATGLFSGNYTAENTYKFAVYPLGGVTNASEYSFDIPASFNSYPSGKVVSPMIALINETSTIDPEDSKKQQYSKLSFKHLCGMVKITANNLPVGTTSLSWTNLGERNINGKYPIIEENLTEANLLNSLDIANVENGSKVTKFSFDKLEAPADMIFYVPLFPGTYEAGFTISISNGVEDIVIGKSSQSQSVGRAMIHSLPAINVTKSFAALENTDVITYADLGITYDGKSTTYTDFSDISISTSAIYAGNSATNKDNLIQLRSSGSNSGIISTTTGGLVKKVSVDWASATGSGRTINVYGKHSAYTAATDLYATESQGELLGTIVYGTSTELVIEEGYEYVALCSNSGALYLSSISIEWGPDTEAKILVADVNGLDATGAVENLEYTLKNSEEAISATTEDSMFEKVEVAEDGTITYIVTPNYTRAERTGTITLTAGVITKDVTITQNADIFEVSPNPITFAAASESTATITVKSSYPFTVSVNEEKLLLENVSYSKNEWGIAIDIQVRDANTTEEAINLGDITITRTTGESDTNKTISIPASQAADGEEEVPSSEVTYDFSFSTIDPSNAWTSSYAQHEYTYPDGAIVNFESANKQGNNITDIPVTKGKYVIVKAATGQTIKSASFICRQWSTKAQTITLYYSADGDNYTSTGVTSDNFSITKDDLPAETIAVKITFSSSSNQVGIQSATLTYN